MQGYSPSSDALPSEKRRCEIIASQMLPQTLHFIFVPFSCFPYPGAGSTPVCYQMPFQFVNNDSYQRRDATRPVAVARALVNYDTTHTPLEFNTISSPRQACAALSQHTCLWMFNKQMAVSPGPKMLQTMLQSPDAGC